VQKYRAGATLDLVHDRADRGRRLTMPLLVLWGRRSSQGSGYDILGVWRDHAETVTGQAIDSGRFLPEEAPDETYRNARIFSPKGADLTQSSCVWTARHQLQRCRLNRLIGPGNDILSKQIHGGMDRGRPTKSTSPLIRRLLKSRPKTQPIELDRFRRDRATKCAV